MKSSIVGKSLLHAVVALLALSVTGCKHGKSPEQLCGEAYDDSFNRMQQSMRENATRYPNITPSGTIGMGDRAPFITRCATLPANVLQCLAHDYMAAHADECRGHAAQIMSVMAGGTPRTVHLGDRP